MLDWIIGLLALIASVVAVLLLLRLAFPLPRAVRDTPGAPAPELRGEMCSQVSTLGEGKDGQTGVLLLRDPVDALAARIAHVRAASCVIDAQYYIWKGDLSGRMLLAELVRAARRGVRVRVLIDDVATLRLDAMWAAAAAVPNFEVRLFNPLTIRKPRPLGWLINPLRLNRRMHNKTMTFDGAVSVVGGRNIGDEYFGAREKGLFIDLDALLVGGVVSEIAEDFDRYWHSVSSFPAQQLLPPASEEDIAAIAKPVHANAALAAEYGEAIAAVQEGTLAWHAGERLVWARVQLFSDNPAKALDRSKRGDLVAVRILPILRGADERLDLVSGYFVPERFGVKLLSSLARAGVAVRVVTNSALVTDKRFVHAAYVPYRRPLLRAGVKLFEVRPRDRRRRPLRERFGPRGPAEMGRTRFSGGGESVHAKTFSVDGRYLFVGSFNFDPRSALLNCEIGFIVDSPMLAEEMNATLDRQVSEAAYAVRLGKLGKLRWVHDEGEDATVYETEPGTTISDRLWVLAYRLLPLEWLL